MKATINGIQVEGTPAEIVELWSAMQPAREDSEERKQRGEKWKQVAEGFRQALKQQKSETVAWNGPLDHQGRPIAHWGARLDLPPQQHQTVWSVNNTLHGKNGGE